jgi:hypothetical protein
MVAWIRIRIPTEVPDPGELKRQENASKRQISRHRKDKKKTNVSGGKLLNGNLFSLKFNIKWYRY